MAAFVRSSPRHPKSEIRPPFINESRLHHFRALPIGQVDAGFQDHGNVIGRRRRDAGREIRNYGQYDYLLINNDLQSSAESLAAIVRAERMRRVRMEPRIQPILATFELESCEGFADVRKDSKK